MPGKISFHRNPSSTTLRLKGELSGLWVDEVARTWCHVVTRSPNKSVIVDLAGVSFIDSEGIKLLRWLFSLEDRFPNFFVRHFQYPMIVLTKRGG